MIFFVQLLLEYLVEKGYCVDVAEDIDSAYYDNYETGVKAYVQKHMNDEDHDYVDEVLEDVRDWKAAVGE